MQFFKIRVLGDFEESEKREQKANKIVKTTFSNKSEWLCD